MTVKSIWPEATFGARLSDIDLTDLNSFDFAKLSALIYEHKVLCIEKQNLTEEQYINFARGLGLLVPFKFKNYSNNNRPEIMILDNQAHVTGVGGRKVGNMWHTDSSHLENPLDLTLLLAKKVPESKYGGQTLFVDTELALEQLDSPTREVLEKTSALHEVLWTYKIMSDDVGQSLKELIDQVRAKNNSAVHSCLSTHSKTGRRNLYLNPGYTTEVLELGATESKTLLEHVFVSALQTENIKSFEWQCDDLLIWDNRSVWHMATAVEDSVARIMHRIGIRETV